MNDQFSRGRGIYHSAEHCPFPVRQEDGAGKSLAEASNSEEIITNLETKNIFIPGIIVFYKKRYTSIHARERLTKLDSHVPWI